MVTVIGNLKGGSGKSTVTFNLGLWLVQQGRQVLLYDFDPQATLSDAVQVRSEEGYDPRLKVYSRQAKPTQQPDEVLIDVGASNMAAMKRAIRAATRVVVPVGPSQADLWATQRFLYIIGSETKEKPPEVFMFLNRADTHSAVRESDETETALQGLPGIQVLSTRLCQRTTYRRSFSEGLAVFELEPSGKAAKEFAQFAEQLYPAKSE